jgi:hypothetical protein
VRPRAGLELAEKAQAAAGFVDFAGVAGVGPVEFGGTIRPETVDADTDRIADLVGGEEVDGILLEAIVLVVRPAGRETFGGDATEA